MCGDGQARHSALGDAADSNEHGVPQKYGRRNTIPNPGRRATPATTRLPALQSEALSIEISAPRLVAVAKLVAGRRVSRISLNQFIVGRPVAPPEFLEQSDGVLNGRRVVRALPV